jgi:hypothetical protein
MDPFIDHNKAYRQLIKNLSLPLDRLEKYVSLLNEYLYNLEVKYLIYFFVSKKYIFHI